MALLGAEMERNSSATSDAGRIPPARSESGHGVLCMFSTGPEGTNRVLWGLEFSTGPEGKGIETEIFIQYPFYIFTVQHWP
jgi:hypothetical protein